LEKFLYRKLLNKNVDAYGGGINITLTNII